MASDGKSKSGERLKKRARKIISRLKKLHPDAKIALKYSNSWELFVAVVLSAQCTDKKVNEVTGRLFKKYRKFDDYLRADRREFERDIKPTGFYRAKAKNILAAAKMINKKFSAGGPLRSRDSEASGLSSGWGGKLPRTMEEMLTIPGVGRKSANVVLGNAYGVVEGIAVDTHVKRLSKKLGLTKESDPVKIERDLMRIVPKKDWFKFTYLLIDYGRKYCKAISHDHKNCPLTKAGF